MKPRLVFLAIPMVVIITLGTFAAISKPVGSTTTYGPRIDQLLCKIYPNSTNEFTCDSESTRR